MNFSGKKEIAERWSQNVRKSIVKSQRQRQTPRSENHEVVLTLALATSIPNGFDRFEGFNGEDERQRPTSVAVERRLG